MDSKETHGHLAHCGSEGHCPLQAVHNRLNAVHEFWHQALNAYPDPDGFRTYLNACIQELRNVTFVLQKNKKLIPGFDSWYGPWQEKMKTDTVLRWSVGARNRIVKEGDLATASTARVAVIKDYGEPPILDVNVPPLQTTEEIATNIAHEAIPETEEGLLRVERRWVAENLPDRELLDALAHAYGVLSQLVEDAHAQAGVTGARTFVREKDGELRPFTGPTEHLAGRLPCMVLTVQHRTVWIDLKTKDILIPTASQLPPQPPEIAKELSERYRVSMDDLVTAERSEGVRGVAEFFFELARVMLKTDGYHIPMAFLILPNGDMQQCVIPAASVTEQRLVWTRMAEEVERIGATAVISISETWGAPYDSEHPNRPPAASPSRFEGLELAVLSLAGDEFIFVCRFERADGGIELGDTEEVSGSAAFLDPVRRVWERRISPPG